MNAPRRLAVSQRDATADAYAPERKINKLLAEHPWQLDQLVNDGHLR